MVFWVVDLDFHWSIIYLCLSVFRYRESEGKTSSLFLHSFVWFLGKWRKIMIFVLFLFCFQRWVRGLFILFLFFSMKASLYLFIYILSYSFTWRNQRHLFESIGKLSQHLIPALTKIDIYRVQNIPKLQIQRFLWAKI